MSVHPIFRCMNKDGNIIIPARGRDYLRNLPEIVEVTVKPWRENRSVQQNKYLWGVVYELISEHTGDSPGAVHKFFTAKYLTDTVEIHTPKGTIEQEFIRSTTELNTQEFSEYTNKIKDWARDFLEMHIPDPDKAEGA
jgi:hypothetical protein